MIQKMMHGCLANTLQGWVEFVKMAKHERLVLARFAAKMKYRAAAMCIATWSDYCTQRNFLRRFMKRAIGGRARNSTVHAFKLWTEFSVNMRQLEMEHGVTSLQELVESLNEKVNELTAKLALTESQLSESAKRKNELAQRSMSRFIQQWQNNCLVTTLMAWKTYTQGCREDKVKMARFIKRMTQGWIVRCFDAWRDDHNESKKNKLIIYRVGQRMRNGLLVRIVNCWRQMVADVKRERYIIDRISRRMLNRTVNGAMASWVEYVCLRKRLKYLALKIFNRLSNGKVFGAFLKWAEFNEELIAEERAEYELRYASEADRKIEMEKRAIAEAKQKAGLKMIQKMMHSCLANTIHSWIAYVRIAKNERAVVARFVKRMKYRLASMCIATWSDFCGQRKFLRRFVKKLLAGKESKSMLGALTTWRANVKDGIRQEIVLEKFARRMRYGTIAKCHSRWLEYVDQRVRMRRLVRTCLGGKRSMMMNAAFKRWYKNGINSIVGDMKDYIENCHDVELRAENTELKKRITELEESSTAIHKLTSMLISESEEINKSFLVDENSGDVSNSLTLTSEESVKASPIVQFSRDHHIVDSGVTTPAFNSFGTPINKRYNKTPPSILHLRSPFKSPKLKWPEALGVKIEDRKEERERIRAEAREAEARRSWEE